MARIPVYHQQQLQTLSVPNPGVDTSSLQIGNNLLQDASALADTVQHAHNQMQNAGGNIIHAALSGLLTFKLAQQKADAKIEKAKQDALISSATAQVGLAQNDLVKESVKVSPDNLDAGNKFYRENYAKVVKQKLTDLKITDPNVIAAVTKNAEQRAVADDRSILNERTSNAKPIADAHLANAASAITDKMTTFTGVDPNAQTLAEGLSAFDQLKPGLLQTEAPDIAEKKIHELKVNGAMSYMRRLIEENPDQAKELMSSGAFQEKDRFVKAPGSDTPNVQLPTLDGDQIEDLRKRYVAKVDAINAQEKLQTKSDTNSGKQAVNTMYAQATLPGTTPDQKHQAETALNDAIAAQLKSPTRNEDVLNFMLARRDDIQRIKTDAEKAAEATRQTKALERKTITEARADESYQETLKNREKAKAAEEHKQYLNQPGNLLRRTDVATAVKDAFDDTKKLDLNTKLDQISRAMALNDQAHKDKLITDEVWVNTSAGLQLKQKQATTGLAKPPSGTQGWLRDNFGKPEEQFYDAVAKGLPDDFFKSKGIAGDSLKTLDFNRIYSQSVIESVEAFKKKHDGNLPDRGSLESIKAKIINILKAKSVQ